MVKEQPTNSNKKHIDVETVTTELKGFKGFIELFLRRFRTASFVLALLPVYLLVILIMALSLTPSVYLIDSAYSFSTNLTAFWHYFVVGLSVVLGFFIYGFCLIFVVPFFNWINPLKLKPFRGPYYSWHSVPWYIHNALVYVVRYTFLEFITPTPFNILFYRMMGMKIGKGVQINTTNISDACLIEMENNVTIGGSAHIICHYAAKGYLVIEPVKIKKGATLGLKCTVMGDVIIGENAVISPHEVVYPKSRIPAGYNKQRQVKIQEIS